MEWGVGEVNRVEEKIGATSVVGVGACNNGLVSGRPVGSGVLGTDWMNADGREGNNQSRAILLGLASASSLPYWCKNVDICPSADTPDAISNNDLHSNVSVLRRAGGLSLPNEIEYFIT